MGGSVLDNGLMDEPSAPSLGQIASVFARYANMTFGGGSATIAVLHEQIVERRRWLSQLQFDLSYALSRLTPGTNLLAFCTAAGWMTRRWAGALVALLAASIPCSLLVIVVTHFYEAWQHNRIVMAALRGALAAAVAITVATAWSFAQPHVKAARLKALVIVPAALLLALRFSLSPMRILLLAAVVGLMWPATGQKT
jgi:chromate transporter